MDPIPRKVGKYEILSRLAYGGMAEVLLARITGQAGFEKLAVVKRVLPHLAHDSGFIEMFADEARISARLDHGNIGQVFEFGEDGDRFYLAMEFVQGLDLKYVYKRFLQRPQIQRHGVAAYVLTRVCSALAYAHARRDDSGRPLHIVHRDVTPSNVLVSFDGDVKLIDFGVARARQRITHTGSGEWFKGKPAYGAPEQLENLKLDHRADIFSAGVVLWELLAGRRLFRCKTDMGTLEAIRSAKIHPPSSLSPGLPGALDQICLRALTRDRERRYPSAGRMQEDLDRLCHELQFGQRQLRKFMQQQFHKQQSAMIQQLQRMRAAVAQQAQDGIQTSTSVVHALEQLPTARDGSEDQTISNSSLLETIPESSHPMAETLPESSPLLMDELESSNPLLQTEPDPGPPLRDTLLDASPVTPVSPGPVSEPMVLAGAPPAPLLEPPQQEDREDTIPGTTTLASGESFVALNAPPATAPRRWPWLVLVALPLLLGAVGVVLVLGLDGEQYTARQGGQVVVPEKLGAGSAVDEKELSPAPVTPTGQPDQRVTEATPDAGPPRRPDIARKALASRTPDRARRAPAPGSRRLRRTTPVARPGHKPARARGPATLVVVTLAGGKTIWANVQVDGKAAGQSPATIRDVKPGKHLVKITREGYISSSRMVHLLPGQKKKVSFTLRR